MKCTACGNDTMNDATSAYFVQLSECYVIIENVPCKQCSQCGEVFFSNTVMERIDDIVADARRAASKIFIRDYCTAA